MTAASSSRTGRDLWAFGRSDRWGLVVLLALVVAGTAASQLVGPLVRWVRGDAMTVPYAADVTVPSLDATGVRYAGGSVDLSVPDPSVGQRVLDLVPGALLTVVVSVGCWLVLRVMWDVAAGDPFRTRNVRRLRVLAFVIAIGIPLVWFARVPIDLALMAGLDLGSGAPATILRIPWEPVVIGSVVALVAEAFRTGARLRDDVEGLV